MLTKAQQLMVDDGLPVDLFRTTEQRAAYWLANPHFGVIPTVSFKDDKRQSDALREQFEREATALRIAKLKAGLVRKAVKLSPRDLRGMRWDSRNNRLIPIDPQESRKMKYDTDKTTAAEATPELVSSTVAVTNEDTMAKTTTKKTAKSAKKPAKKAVAKKTKKTAAKKSGAKPAATPRGEGVIATIIKTIGRANGASADECLEVLVKAFPDRAPESMRKTVMIQANKNAKSKERSEKRGVVYYGHK